MKTFIEVKCLWILTNKKRHSLRGFLFACAAINQVNLGFRATIIDDTHLTLTGIPFKVEANNSLIFLSLQIYEKKIAEFLFLFIFIIPCHNLEANMTFLRVVLSCQQNVVGVMNPKFHNLNRQN